MAAGKVRAPSRGKAVLSPKANGKLSTPVDPRSVGVEPKVLKDYEDAMVKMVKIGAIPGCASVVFRKGQLLHSGSWGFADVEKGAPFGFDTYCRMYCATKSYVAVAFMRLVDEGLVRLEDRLDKYIPAFAHVLVMPEGSEKREKPKRPILLKHLLSHTSGIGYTPELGAEPEDAASAGYLKVLTAVLQGSIRSLKIFVEGLAKVPLLCHPGHKYNYSLSFDVLGRVLEVITGKRLDLCLKELVFRPLGMNDTKWAVQNNELDRLAAVYASPGSWKKLYGQVKGKVPSAPRKGLCRIDGNTAKESHWRDGQQISVLSGGGFMGYLYGGLVSTVADTATFVQMLMRFGLKENGQRYLKKSSVVAMEKNRLKPAVDGDSKVCYLGNISVFREGSEYGMGGAACTYWCIDREDEIASVWFTQHIDMAEFGEMKGIDPKKADLWGALHKAVLKGAKEAETAGAKRKRSTSSSTPSKRVKA
mmetsp:Transcript_60072/g.108121  ORF Transcript_60072/g.108121 Transcript_60072/m.108121 type:complete len:475 (+) Transcript_60072:81-1505(+)